jgi:hypothetical protein
MAQGLAANGPNPQRQWFFGRRHHDVAGANDRMQIIQHGLPHASDEPGVQPAIGSDYC